MCRKPLLYLLCAMLILFGLDVASCKEAQPKHVTNVCSIFKQHPKWYWSALDVQKKWHLPVPVLMAIIYQESRFDSTAKPAREKLLWIIPWNRPTSAYGYSQALKNTWKNYKRSTHQTFASRDTFSDAADFIGWYANQANRRAGISTTNAYQLYLAYHEGIGGYKRKTYAKKRWLMRVAHKVQTRANIYRAQLNQCEPQLPIKPFWHIW